MIFIWDSHAERIRYLERDLKRLQEGNISDVESPDLLMAALQELSELDAVTKLEVFSELKAEAPELHDAVKEVAANAALLDSIRLRINTVNHRIRTLENGRVVIDLELFGFGGSTISLQCGHGGYSLGRDGDHESLGIVCGRRVQYAEHRIHST